ncbi:putative sulfate exporter family transporter [Bacillus timonensis]|nr:putative sulfate exporter family transporter [Bacillus timonensis]
MRDNMIQKMNSSMIDKIYRTIPGWTLGFLFLVLIAYVAKILGLYFPVIGGVIFALLIGGMIRNTMGIHHSFEVGVSFVVKRILKLAIILLGASLSFGQIIQIGNQSIIIILAVVVGGIGFTIVLGKLLKVDSLLSLMIGVGASICGATAITALKGTIQAKETQTAYAISTIFFFNIIATVTYPFLGHLLNLTALQFGIWAGTSVHDTSSVVAVGYLFGQEAGDIATTVKLVRTLFLLPILLIIPLLFLKKEGISKRETIIKAFPWFIVGFVAMSIVNSFGFISVPVQTVLIDIAKYFILMVMAGVGLQVDIRQLFKLGYKPLLIGLIASVIVSGISLLLIFLLV